MWRAHIFNAVKPFGGFEPRNRKVAIVGIPMDFTSSYRAGSRFAPDAIREISYSLELCSVYGECVVEEQGVDDLGNLIPIAGSAEATLKLVEDMARDVLSEGRKLIAIGGDHTVTVGLFAGVTKNCGSEPCLLVVDAHLDLREELAGRYSHASAIRRILEVYAPPRVVWFGARAFSKEELEYLERLGVEYLVVKSVDILKQPSHWIEKTAQYLAPCGFVYLSVDFDGFDPAYAPGVQTPEPIGIAPIHLLELLRSLQAPIVSSDIVEISPPYDASGVTAALGARMVVEIAMIMYKATKR